MPEKPKLAMYWAASCGGCEISLVNIHEHLLDVEANFDFVFCPCLLDTKKKDVEAMPDGSLAITFFNGAIRTGENEEMARLLRRKSQLLIAYGSCSSEGCIPALSNLSTKTGHFRSVYTENVTSTGGAIPQSEVQVPEGTLRLPEFYDRVKTLAQTTGVDYFIPGCPPESHQVWAVIETVIRGGPLPPRGSVLGAGSSSVCDECERKNDLKLVKAFHRNYEIIPDTSKCLLEQGMLCLGPATRDGCGALCPAVNMPCIGCYGPSEGSLDQGAKMISALGSMMDISALPGKPEQEINDEVDRVLDGIPDPAGTFYKFSLAASLLKGGRR